MRVTGAATLSQPPSAVWSALNDPAVLARAIPGCERLDVTGPGACALTVLAGIAAVAGSYAGKAQAAERTAPGLIRATVSGSGNRGQVGADVTVRLKASGDTATEVTYEADIRADGPVAVVGQRVLASVARRLASQFLAGIEGALSLPSADNAGANGAGDADGADEVDSAGGAGDVSLIDQARRGIGVRGTRAPAENLPAPAGYALPAGVRAGLAAGAAVGLAGIVIGILLSRRARAGGRVRLSGQPRLSRRARAGRR